MITSTGNRQVKEVQKLQKSPKFRNERRQFVVEGRRMMSEVPEDRLIMAYVAEDQVDKFASEVPAAKMEVVTDHVMKAMSLEKTSQGILALVASDSQAKDFIFEGQPLILALDRVQDPGNLGTIIRTAEAAGVDQLILSDGTVDLYNPKVIKSTMGAIFRMNICKDVDLEKYIGAAKTAGIQVYAAHLKGEKYHFEMDLSQGTCFIMGNEGNGVRDEISKKASQYLKIPMTPEAESLNVAMASGILIYEAVRQRMSGHSEEHADLKL